MSSIVFQTPGLIDIRAFTLMGVSAKPNSNNPIGHFGTGLKYAVATILRLGGSITVWIGRDEHTFYTEKDSFRGIDYSKIRMRRKRWSLTKATNHDLPFTLQYGRNWQAWQAFRELESNTRDEGGETFITDHDEFASATDDKTHIVVSHMAFTKAYESRDDIFLPYKTLESTGVIAGVVGNPSRFYYRGLRVRDLPKPACFVYNVLDRQTLTEDRTLAEYYAKTAVAGWLIRCIDEVLIEKVLTCDEECWEHEMDFPSWITPSEAFRNVVRRRKRDVFPTAVSYYGLFEPPAPRKRLTANPWVAHPLPWTYCEGSVQDANNVVLFERPGSYTDDDAWQHLAEALCRRLERKKEDTQ